MTAYPMRLIYLRLAPGTLDRNMITAMSPLLFFMLRIGLLQNSLATQPGKQEMPVDYFVYVGWFQRD
jgi:hypothetical protein